jgi:hypothetical protein
MGILIGMVVSFAKRAAVQPFERIRGTDLDLLIRLTSLSQAQGFMPEPGY